MHVCYFRLPAQGQWIALNNRARPRTVHRLPRSGQRIQSMKHQQLLAQTSTRTLVKMPVHQQLGGLDLHPALLLSLRSRRSRSHAFKKKEEATPLSNQCNARVPSTLPCHMLIAFSRYYSLSNLRHFPPSNNPYYLLNKRLLPLSHNFSPIDNIFA